MLQSCRTSHAVGAGSRSLAAWLTHLRNAHRTFFALFPASKLRVAAKPQVNPIALYASRKTRLREACIDCVEHATEVRRVRVSAYSMAREVRGASISAWSMAGSGPISQPEGSRQRKNEGCDAMPRGVERASRRTSCALHAVRHASRRTSDVVHAVGAWSTHFLCPSPLPQNCGKLQNRRQIAPSVTLYAKRECVKHASIA